MKRRTFLIAASVAAVATGGATFAYIRRDRFEGAVLTPPQAAELAQSGEITLIDIRRPDEWDKTGVPAGGHPIDMRRDDFVAALDALVDADKDSPIALICARGVRSDRLSARLTEAGFTNIIDIPEGMLGSSAGPGWLERGLPVTKGS